MTDAKDVLLPLGVLITIGLSSVTLVLGLVNLYFTLRTAKRTAFINTVTSERVKWIAKIRDNVSLLCSLCDQRIWHWTQDGIPDLQQKIEQIKNEVRLQLNPIDPEDRDIERLLARLPTSTNSMTHEAYGKLQDTLVLATQAMLKREWDKVKDEALRGDLRKR